MSWLLLDAAMRAKKPNDYKCIEVCLSDPKAVIAMKSACYYQGLIEQGLTRRSCCKICHTMILYNDILHYFPCKIKRQVEYLNGSAQHKKIEESGTWASFKFECPLSYCSLWLIHDSHKHRNPGIHVHDHIQKRTVKMNYRHIRQ